MNSQEYWIKREKEWQKQQIKDDKKRMAEIKSRMQYAQDAIQKEIDAQWDSFSNGQKITRSEAMKRASEMDVKAFARKAKKYVKEKDFSPTANQELKLYNLTMLVNRLELLKANIGLELISLFNELDKYFSNELTKAGLAELKRQAGILEMTISSSGYAKLIELVINSSFLSDDVSFSDRLWMYQSELKSELDRLLVRSKFIICSKWCWSRWLCNLDRRSSRCCSICIQRYRESNFDRSIRGLRCSLFYFRRMKNIEIKN